MSGLSKSILVGILGIFCVAEASATTYWCKKDVDSDGVYSYAAQQWSPGMGFLPPFPCRGTPADPTGWTYATANPIEVIPDNCASVSNANQLNTDGDAQGNACDTDDDNDGVVDSADAFPLNAAESLDTDHDGIGNNADFDDDGDGVPDYIDADPLNPAINTEKTLPLNETYIGSSINETAAVQ